MTTDPDTAAARAAELEGDVPQDREPNPYAGAVVAAAEAIARWDSRQARLASLEVGRSKAAQDSKRELELGEAHELIADLRDLLGVPQPIHGGADDEPADG